MIENKIKKPTKVEKALFVAELNTIIPHLPSNYASMINYNTGISKAILYRVRNYGTVHYNVLTAMKELIAKTN